MSLKSFTITANSATANTPDAGHSVNPSLQGTPRTSFHLSGAFGGGTATLVVSPDGNTWVPTSVTLTATGVLIIPEGLNCQRVGVNLSGATAPNINVDVI